MTPTAAILLSNTPLISQTICTNKPINVLPNSAVNADTGANAAAVFMTIVEAIGREKICICIGRRKIIQRRRKTLAIRLNTRRRTVMLNNIVCTVSVNDKFG
eukprot:c20525_g9_i1.p2 GENE.c20525_g9_i1~~c20525_g9_i1.p2  ORF type:complete len:102 (-),score=6.85 c20525_g9_i1:188-493(-)